MRLQIYIKIHPSLQDAIETDCTETVIYLSKNCKLISQLRRHLKENIFGTISEIYIFSGNIRIHDNQLCTNLDHKVKYIASIEKYAVIFNMHNNVVEISRVADCSFCGLMFTSQRFLRMHRENCQVYHNYLQEYNLPEC